MSDDKPEQHPTTKLAAVDPVTEALGRIERDVRASRADIGALAHEFGTTKNDVRELQKWVIAEEERRDIESARAPLTSDRVKKLINEHPSQLELDTAAEQAKEIIKGRERDRRIEETHRLATGAATKADVAGVAEKADTAITKVNAIAESQDLQFAILQRVDKLFNFYERIRDHRLTRLIVAIATLSLAAYATSRGIK